MIKSVILLVCIFIPSYCYSETDYLHSALKPVLEKNIVYYDAYLACLTENKGKFKCGENFKSYDKAEFERITRLRDVLLEKYASIYKVKFNSNSYDNYSLESSQIEFYEEAVDLQLKILILYASMQRDCGVKDYFSSVTALAQDYFNYYKIDNYSFASVDLVKYQEVDIYKDYKVSECAKILEFYSRVFLNVFQPISKFMITETPKIKVAAFFVYYLSRDLAKYPV